MTTTRPRRLAAALLAATCLLSACSSGSNQAEDEAGPEEALASAKAALDETSGVHIVLATEKLPAGVSGILGADGIGTHAPAFEGTIKAAVGGIGVDVPVIAVDDVVYAKLPFTTGYTEIDPAEYSAPDPADLMSPDGGLSSLLTSAVGVEEGDQVRDGSEVLTEYTGTVAGEAVARIIPSASADSEFDVTFTLTEDNRLAEAVLTGAFYPEADDVTYTVAFDQYGTSADIAAP